MSLLLLSSLAPNRLTCDAVQKAIWAGDMLANKYRGQWPDDVLLAWGEHLRPALDRYRARLEDDEYARRRATPGNRPRAPDAPA
jgi:hypothetical protein